MNNQPVQNKPTAAYYLALIGGIIGLIAGIFLLIIIIGIWIIISSVIVIVAAQKLNEEPMEHTKWGTIIIIFSIVGIGSLLALIGGILALTYNPIPIGAQSGAMWNQPASPQQITRICPQCGRIIENNVKFCPHCGKELP
jgi:hypothetical protein